MTLPRHVRLSEEVAQALTEGAPVVALETAVATHGLPAPYNLQVAREMEDEIRESGATPATCLIFNGELLIGTSADQLAVACRSQDTQKASVRDLGAVIQAGGSAGLTVSASLAAAHIAGIRVFATGGIGGVHADIGRTGDVSADLFGLARTPVVTVCSGAKSVLDIPRTLEQLESYGVPAFAYRTEWFPAFYLTSSGSRAPRLEDAAHAACIALTHWELGVSSSLVVGNPVPASHAIAQQDWDAWLARALQSATEADIIGKEVTPYLLARVAEYSAGSTVAANLALLRSNAALAAEIAVAMGL